MATGGDSSLEFRCPKCGQKLRAPKSSAGRRLTCPKCEQSVKVPGASAAQSNDDDWLSLDDAPNEAVTVTAFEVETVDELESQSPSKSSETDLRTPKASPAKPASTPKLPTPKPAPIANTASASKPKTSSVQPAANSNQQAAGASGFDMDDFTLAPPEVTAPVANWSTDFIAQLSAESQGGSTSNALDDKDLPSLEAKFREEDAEYRVKCRTCGTSLYVTMSKKGKTVRCPDCYSDFIAPGPPPNWDPKQAAKKGRTQRAVDDVPTLSAPEPVSDGNAQSQNRLANEYLSKAHSEIVDKHLEKVYTASDFDSQAFFQKTFRYLADPGVILHLLCLGVVSGLAMAGCRWLIGATGESAMYGILVPLICLPAVFVVLLVSAACGTAVMEAAANGRDEVTEWPIFSPGDWISDALPAIAASIYAILPGAVLGLLLVQIQHGGILAMMALLFSFWVCLPVCLLGVLDNQSIAQPISSNVFRSFSLAFDEWGVYYFKTAIASFLLFLLMAIGWNSVIWQGLVSSLIPFAIFFAFNQLGVLGHEIAEHLSGVEEEEEEQETTQPLK